jgi:hypothetical protein
MRVTAVLTGLSAALFVVGAQVASADTGVTEGRLATGTVGIVAVAIGMIGLVAGLLLRRRRTSGARIPASPERQPEPARSKTAA